MILSFRKNWIVKECYISCLLQCLKKHVLKMVFMISDESKDKEFQSAVNNEQQMYLQRIKELENMVCEFLILLDFNK